MFLTSVDYWIAAVVEQQQQWTRGDQNFIRELGGDFSAAELWKFAGAYRVARNFPMNVRPWFEKEVRQLSVKSYDDFVNTCRALARKTKQHERKTGRRYLALSGVSKILFHRFPAHGFIYDELARKAILQNGLATPFYNLVSGWGGDADDDPREWDFLIFAAAYSKFLRPIQPSLIADIKRHDDKQWQQAPRIIDKLLWISGGSKKAEYLEQGRRMATDAQKALALVGCSQAAKLLQ